MHSLCSGENILIAASIEVLVVLLHSIARARRKCAIFRVKYCSSNNSYLWKGEIKEQLRSVLTVLYKAESCSHSEGHFYFVYHNWTFRTCSQILLTSLWNSLELHTNRWEYLFSMSCVKSTKWEMFSLQEVISWWRPYSTPGILKWGWCLEAAVWVKAWNIPKLQSGEKLLFCVFFRKLLLR